MKRNFSLILLALLPALSFASTFKMRVILPGLKPSVAASAPAVPATPDFQELKSGGLTLVKPSTAMLSIGDTFALCATVINGTSGWRVPTTTDWSKLQGGISVSAFAAAGYNVSPGEDWVWTSEIRSGANYWVGQPANGIFSYTGDPAKWYAVCVKG